MRAPSSRSFASVRLFLHSPPPCVSRLTSLPKSALSATAGSASIARARTFHRRSSVPLFYLHAFTCLVTLIIPEKSILQHLLSPSVPVVLLFRPLRDYARGGSLSCEELGLQVSSRRSWMEIDVNVPRKQPPPVLLSPSPTSHSRPLLHSPSSLSTEHHTDDRRCYLKEPTPGKSR